MVTGEQCDHAAVLASRLKFIVYYTDSDVFLADSMDLSDISDFFADILTFYHNGWEN